MTDAGEDCGIIDLVAIQVKNREDRTVGDWVEEFGAVPARSKRACLGLTISDHCDGNEVGVIEDCAKGV
jgi:hypothetical protein